ncbi:MAG: glucose dehydrogenase [Chloroflexi bacterium]|nr:MAG: glucose dehydrogenase [Chloroflexota bacterium]
MHPRKMIYYLVVLFVLLIGLLACQAPAPTSTPVPTPDIIQNTPDSLPPTLASVTDTPTPTITEPTTAPPTPTAVPTQPLPTATTPATETPAPVTAVSTITLVPILTRGLTKPVFLTHAFDDRLFIVEQPGIIRIAQNGTLLPEPFLDITDRVGSDAFEQGLFSVAFHPAYQENGRFFVNYTDKSGNTVIARYQVSENPNQANPDSETILLYIPQPYANHNGGQLQFGPDGYLYIGMGDGGNAGDPLGHGQNPATLLGAMLRIDVDHTTSDKPYAIPPDNPFITEANKLPEIWAYGLRNPWRFSFDRITGDMFIADVGQNQWEEVHFQPASSTGGENYGWNILEGSHCFIQANCATIGLELPIFEYDHSEGCSITGGYVYRGQQFPALWGNYFVADFCSGNIWAVTQTETGNWSARKVLESGLRISSFGEDVNGELYVVVMNGRIFQIQP